MNCAPWIETYTGKQFWFLNPTPEMFDIEDIAHALSMVCRYAGHVTHFYSVAAHCCVMADYFDHATARASVRGATIHLVGGWVGFSMRRRSNEQRTG